MSGGSRVTLELGLLMRSRGRISSSTLRARRLEQKALVVQRVGRRVVPLVEGGSITVPVERTFPLGEAQEAYDAFAAGGKFGKLVLAM
jgi:NADPH:quinone reductase